jgi:nitroreductase
MKLNLSADDVLATTRAVRKRLDFDRPVEREVIEECLQLALQAPTGSNRQGWQWIFVTDPEKKRALADIYAANFVQYRNVAAANPFPECDLRAEQSSGITSSAEYLTENFHRVPVMMIPCIEGQLDRAPTFAAASVWGSILPAVWSFMLAARERGLGTAWTTIH